MDAALREKIYQRLRVSRPAGAAAVMRNGTIRELSVKGGNSKGKWHRLIDTIAQLDAEALEIYDGDGAIQELIPLTDRELESLTEKHADRLEEERERAPIETSDPTVREAGFIASLALDSADRQVARFNDLIAVFVEGMRSASEAQTQALNMALSRLAHQERELAHVVGHLRELQLAAPAESSDGPLNAMAGQLMGKLLTGGAPSSPFPPKPNGAKTNPATDPNNGQA